MVKKSGRKNIRRQVVLVLGMHRSGTSALSGVLAALGAQAPKSLMVPTKDNPKGYWESTALMRFHDEILASAGSKWNDWSRFNPDWLDTHTAESFAERLPALLEKEYEDANVILVKDPRICRILPLWVRVMEREEMDLKVLMTLRHPGEVARSLETRDGYTDSLSYVIWLRNVLEAEVASRGLVRSFVRYSELIRDWRGQVGRFSSELGMKWPRWSGAVESEIEQYLSEGLRRAAVRDDEAVKGNPELAEWVNLAYSALCQLVDSPELSQIAMQNLNDIKHDFDRTCAALAAVVHETGQHSEAAILAAKRKTDDSARVQAIEVENLAEQLRGKEKQLQAQQIDAQTIADDLSRRLALASDANVALEEGFTKAINESEAKIGELNQKLATLEIEKRNLMQRHRSELSDLVDQLKTRDGELTKLQQSHDTTLLDLESLHARKMKQLQLEKSKIEESLESRFTEIASMTTMLLDAEQLVSTSRKQIDERDHQIESLTNEIARQAELQSGQRAQHERELNAADAELTLACDAVVEYRKRIGTLLGSKKWKLASSLFGSRLTVQAALDIADEDVSEVDLLSRSGLFDKMWYLAKYPDVKKHGMDPFKHYLLYGAREERDPGPRFSTKGYLAMHEDVAASGINPLIHYLRYGLREGRSKANRKA